MPNPKSTPKPRPSIAFNRPGLMAARRMRRRNHDPLLWESRDPTLPSTFMGLEIREMAPEEERELPDEAIAVFMGLEGDETSPVNEGFPGIVKLWKVGLPPTSAGRDEMNACAVPGEWTEPPGLPGKLMMFAEELVANPGRWRLVGDPGSTFGLDANDLRLELERLYPDVAWIFSAPQGPFGPMKACAHRWVESSRWGGACQARRHWHASSGHLGFCGDVPGHPGECEPGPAMGAACGKEL